MYEIKSKKDQLHIQKEETIRKIQDNQEKINQLSEDSKELRQENEVVKTKIEQKLQSNPLVKELEDQKEKLSKEISAIKAQIDDARKAFNKKMEEYDSIRFKKARIEYMKELKQKQFEVQKNERNEKRTIERINKDLEEQIQKIKQEKEEQRERIKEIQKILEEKQKEIEQSQQEAHQESIKNLDGFEILQSKKKSPLVVPPSKTKKSKKEVSQEITFDSQTNGYLKLYHVQAPKKKEDIPVVIEKLIAKLGDLDKKEQLEISQLESKIKSELENIQKSKDAKDSQT